MILRSAVHAVVFDMDGLIFDTERLYIRAALDVAGDMDVELAQELLLGTVGLPASDTERLWKEHLGAGFDVGRFWRVASERFEELAERGLELKPGVIELLDLLDERQLPRAIATSTAKPRALRHLEQAKLMDRFETVIAPGDYAQGKPDPAPYLVAANWLETDPAHCLALEDSFNGIRSASGAGMVTVMVPDLIEPDDEIRRLAQVIARDLFEVRDLLA